MGLGWGEAVPVDTHVWQIAQRDYKFGKGKHASLTKDTYDAIGEKFRALWGQEAGWAQSVLFTANLRAFTERLVEKKEEVEVKVEEGTAGEEDVVKNVKIMGKRVKRPFENEGQDDKKVVEISERVKMRKRRKAS
jgi:N-glycosylase/DNA lyase